MLLLDFYVYQAIKTVSQNTSDKSKLIIQIIYWGISIATLASLLSLPYIQALQTNKIFRKSSNKKKTDPISLARNKPTKMAKM